MDVWDGLLLAAAAYLGVMTLVRLMSQRRETLLDELTQEVEREKQRVQEEQRQERRRQRRQQLAQARNEPRQRDTTG